MVDVGGKFIEHALRSPPPLIHAIRARAELNARGARFFGIASLDIVIPVRSALWGFFCQRGEGSPVSSC